jgi:hypothetical protein
MTNPSNNDSSKRFRAIMDGDKDEDEAPKPPASRRSIPPRNLLDDLPRASVDASPSPESTPAPTPPSATKTRLGSGLRFKVQREALHSAFWDVTSWVGLAVDVVTIAVIILLVIYVRRLNIKYNELLGMVDMPVDAVSGLYENFERMNGAHIRTSIPFNTEIPVQFDLQINQQTEVVLSQAITINGAHVTLATGGLEINSVASIVLPAGTRLPITLSLNVPVNKTVPVSLQVPVDIDLATTDLGASFTGLMDVLEPLYCLLDPNAVDKDGVSICEKAKFPPTE